MPNGPTYEFMNLPGYRQLSDAEVATYEKSVEEEIMPLLNEQELDKEQEAVKVATFLTD